MSELFIPFCLKHGQKTLVDYEDHFIWECPQCEKEDDSMRSFDNEREAFRLWVSSLTDRELEHVENDVRLNIEYRKIRPKCSADAFDDIMNKNFNQ